MKNINTENYWNQRFSTGDWERKRGRLQTRQFAESQIKNFGIPSDFEGSILDFGCGLGDAFPVYKKAFPKAKLFGIDISDKAIEKCNTYYGDLAEFIAGDYNKVPNVDIIISSNVFEHLTNDQIVAEHLLKRCKKLYIIVPYKEDLIIGSEHVNTYDENYFTNIIHEYETKVFTSKAWGRSGLDLFYHIYFKNLIKPFFGRKIVKRPKQIMFILNNKSL